MAVVWFAGAETGDIKEFGLTSGTAPTAVTTPKRTGAYAYKLHGTSTESRLAQTLANLTSAYSRMYLYVDVTTNPSPASLAHATIAYECATDEFSLRSTISTAGVFQLQLNSALLGNIGSAFTLVNKQWYLIEMKVIISATVGIMEWKLDGVVKATQSSLNTGTNPINQFRVRSLIDNTGVMDLYFDDLAVSDSDYLGSGGSVARQGKAGTPTYDAFTKNGAATAALCWSDTPFSTATNCTDSTAADAQTMLTESFAVQQSGHGCEILNDSQTVNACKAAVVAKIAVGSNHSIRRRLNGADTDTAKTLTTTDAYYDDGIWTDTLANLNSAEIGMLHGADANLLTVEDAWLIVDTTTDMLVPQIHC